MTLSENSCMMNPCSEEEYFHILDNMVIQSTQYLRQIFKKRWKVESGEEWKDEQNYIQNFLSHHCEHILKKAIPLQKKILLDSCNTDNWDLSLMSLILLNFGDWKKYKLHNTAVRQLTNLRNDLAHHKTKKITQNVYSEKVKLFIESLQMLEVVEFEINKLIEESSLSSSSEAIERVKILVENAEQLSKMQKFESALKQYSDALTIPGLARVSLGEIYEKRAACYLSIQDEHVLNGKHADQALLDAEQALKLNELSWNAHYLKAQCHRKKNNLPEAIRYFEMALALSPMQKQIRQDLDSCILLKEEQKVNSRLNLDHLPTSLNEQVHQLEIQSGLKLGLENIIETQTEFPAFLGDQYYHGWEVPQNYDEAVKYYFVAYKQGDAEGCFKLGRCYFDGHGVKQDIGKGFAILQLCAGMNPRQLGRCEPTPLGFNVFVAKAEYNIGKCYEEGVFVEKDSSQAAFWFANALQHGLGEAAPNMGRIFSNCNIGDSLPICEKMAEMCWKQGIIFKSSICAELLVEYYCCQFELEMAWIMLNIAREMGSSKYLEMSDEEFSRDLPVTMSQRSMMEEYVIAFEKWQNFGFKGMTLKQRLFRMEEYVDPSHAQMRTNLGIAGELQQISEDVMSAVRLKAISGSKTASEVVEIVENILKLNELLEIDNDFSKAYKLKLVNCYYELMLPHNQVIQFMTNEDKFKIIVAELFTETCEQIGEDEMKIRFCYVSENLRQSLESRDDLYAIGILKEGLRRYPEKYRYHSILIECLKTRSSYKTALQHINEALEKFPEKVDLLYEKADILLKCRNRTPWEIITAFKTFLSHVPEDHRLVPEAYYAITNVHVADYVKDEREKKPKSKKLKKIRKTFKIGKDTEKEQLPCYQPYGVSDIQLRLTRFLARYDKKDTLDGNSDDQAVGNEVKEKPHVSPHILCIQSPVRTGLILEHRRRLREAFELIKRRIPFSEEIFPVNLQQPRAKNISQLKPIALQEMNPTKEKIYENRILDLTIIDYPNPYYAAIEIIAEDENGDTTRVYLDHSQNKNRLHMFQAGCRFSVINPYMWIIAINGINGIRINEPKCIIHLEKVKDMCRSCGEENATYKCSNFQGLFCSTECQMLGQNLFEHKLLGL